MRSMTAPGSWRSPASAHSMEPRRRAQPRSVPSSRRPWKILMKPSSPYHFSRREKSMYDRARATFSAQSSSRYASIGPPPLRPAPTVGVPPRLPDAPCGGARSCSSVHRHLASCSPVPGRGTSAHQRSFPHKTTAAFLCVPDHCVACIPGRFDGRPSRIHAEWNAFCAALLGNAYPQAEI